MSSKIKGRVNETERKRILAFTLVCVTVFVFVCVREKAIFSFLSPFRCEILSLLSILSKRCQVIARLHISVWVLFQSSLTVWRQTAFNVRRCLTDTIQYPSWKRINRTLSKINYSSVRNSISTPYCNYYLSFVLLQKPQKNDFFFQ